MKAKHDAIFARTRRVWGVVGLGLALLTPGAPVRAASLQSTIQDTVKSTYEKLTRTGAYKPNGQGVSQQQLQDLNAFLKKGPAYWSVTAPYRIPAGLQSQVLSTDGTLKDTLLTRYLVWKRDQAPEFFDSRHKSLAAAMQQNDSLRTQAQVLAIQKFLTAASTSTSQTTSTQQLLPTTSSSTTTAATTSTASSSSTSATHTTNPAAQTLGDPAPVPEPASVASTLVLFGAAGLWQRRRLRARVAG